MHRFVSAFLKRENGKMGKWENEKMCVKWTNENAGRGNAHRTLLIMLIFR